MSIYDILMCMNTTTEPQPGKFINPAEIIHLLELKEGSTLADFGSGSGAYVLAAAPLVGQTGTVYAVDIQKDLLLKLKQGVADAGHTNVTFLWCNFEEVGATQLPDQSLDVVIISNTLFQLESKSGALKEAHRVLKNTGKLYIIDWSESYKGMGPEEALVVTKSGVLDFATVAGFVLQSEFNPGEHHYGLIFNKK